MSTSSSKLDELDEVSRAFFEATAKGKLVLWQCVSCGACYVLPVEVCAQDLGASFTTRQASGRGVVYTFAVVHHVYGPQYEDRVPYNIAVIQLEEGPRFSSTIRGVENEDIRVGMPVEVFFEEVDGLSIPYFRSVSDSPEEGSQ